MFPCICKYMYACMWIYCWIKMLSWLNDIKQWVYKSCMYLWRSPSQFFLHLLPVPSLLRRLKYSLPDDPAISELEVGSSWRNYHVAIGFLQWYLKDGYLHLGTADGATTRSVISKGRQRLLKGHSIRSTRRLGGYHRVNCNKSRGTIQSYAVRRTILHVYSTP